MERLVSMIEQAGSVLLLLTIMMMKHT